MMKMTRKDATNLFGMTVRVGYCDLQYFLDDNTKVGINHGLYGWNWNCYRVWNSDMSKCVNVVTGYRNLIGYDLPIDMVEKYNRLGYLTPMYNHDRVNLIDSFVNDVYNHILG